MIFIPVPSRAAVEGPTLNGEQILVASLRSGDRSHHSPSAQSTSGRPSYSNRISCRSPHPLARRLGPSTTARVTFLVKSAQRLASAQDDGVVKREMAR